MEISKIIASVKKEGSLGDISIRFLRACVPFILKPLCNFFNLCITSGVFPDIMKLAKINPVFKKGSTHIVTNYRPISILCNISKIFESIMYNRLNNFLMSQNILSERQYGFRKGKNTELAVLDLLHRVLPSIQDKKFAICVFLDYSACFDTICRDILLKKLERYGVRNSCLNLFKSYLTDRRQYVEYKNFRSADIFNCERMRASLSVYGRCKKRIKSSIMHLEQFCKHILSSFSISNRLKK